MNYEVTKKAAAEFFGVTTQSLDRWFTTGCPVARRDRNGDIAAVDISEMARWRIDRAYDAKNPVNEQFIVRDLEHFTCVLLVPALIDHLYRGTQYIANELGLPIETIHRAWSLFAFILHDGVAKTFGKDEISLNYSPGTSAAFKQIGARSRAQRRSQKGK